MQVRGTYTNPLVTHASPDPFVLKHRDRYWCYCTGWASENLVFPVFESIDLVHWNPAGGAMRPIEGSHPQYWAPEVTYWEGLFYLYYSVGDGTVMHLRAAVADTPTGPFTDCARDLTSQDFAIDAHVFEDDDGRRWMFYATDFLEHTHIGTGTVRDRLIDPLRLEGKPVPVVRAQFDWHLFDAQRKEKGGVRWHTIEGPAVLKHKGIYYEMFSGGNWQNTSYGVGYAFTKSIDNPEEWTQACDGDRVRPLLRTVSGHVSGPGHNSVVRGPDNRQWYCVYHRWNENLSERVLAIDRMEWVGRKLEVFGPTYSPQPMPNLPGARFNFETRGESGIGEGWLVTSGTWVANAGSAVQTNSEGMAEARYVLPPRTGVVVECSLRLASASSGSCGLYICDNRDRSLGVLLAPLKHNLKDPGARTIVAQTQTPEAFHLLRVETTGRLLTVFFDGRRLANPVALDGFPQSIALVSDTSAAEFSGFALTRGWEDIFADGQEDLNALEWLVGSGAWQVASMELHHNDDGKGAIFKGTPAPAYELVVNARLTKTAGAYGFFPASSDANGGPLVMIAQRGGEWVLGLDRHGAGDPNLFGDIKVLPGFDPYDYQQFRCCVHGGVAIVGWRNQTMFEIPVPMNPGRVGVWAAGHACFDMIRTVELAVQ